MYSKEDYEISQRIQTLVFYTRITKSFQNSKAKIIKVLFFSSCGECVSISTIHVP